MTLPTKCVVIVSPHFPPSTLASVHRARHLAKHLPAAGWRPIVLCVDEKHHTERLDPELATLVPSDVEIVRVPAISASLARRVGIGDIGLRGWASLKRVLLELLANRPVAAVLITGSPFYPMLLASEVKRRFDIPVVLDFQDPWVSPWGASQSLLSKPGLVHRLASWLEPQAISDAAFITSVSEVQNEEMRRRYAWLSPAQMAAVPIGGDPEDFAAVRLSGARDRGLPAPPPGQVNFSYVGTALPRSAPLFSVLFRALRRLLLQDPEVGERIRLNFIGTSNQPNHIGDNRIKPLAALEGVGRLVNEIPSRLPYFDALAWLGRSDGILLIGSDEPHYTASKIYPALMSGRPFLSLYHRASSAHGILSQSGGGRALAFGDLEGLAELEEPIADALRQLAISPQSLGCADPGIYAPYTAQSVAAQFAGIFDGLQIEGREI